MLISISNPGLETPGLALNALSQVSYRKSLLLRWDGRWDSLRIRSHICNGPNQRVVFLTGSFWTREAAVLTSAAADIWIQETLSTSSSHCGLIPVSVSFPRILERLPVQTGARWGRREASMI